MGNFQKLRVWNLAKNLAVNIYKEVESNDKLRNDFRLTNQLTSSAVSISSNIAEGDELNTVKQGINHLYIAKGSCAELITQLIVTFEIGKIDKETYSYLVKEAEAVSASLLRSSASPGYPSI